MKEHFIISFLPGTSGRFISGLLWDMLSNNTHYVPFTKFNSSHNYEEYQTSWDMSTAGDIHNPNIYSEFKFLPISDLGVFHTHVYPNFSHIENYIPDIKLIIISFDFDDISEIVSNQLFKNQLSNLQARENGLDYHQQTVDRYLSIYELTFGTPYTGTVDSLTDDDIHRLHTAMNSIFRQLILRKTEYWYFIKPIIPESIQHKTLVIKYKDLVTKDENNYVGLTKLAAFANRIPNSSNIDRYCRYVNGRTEFMKNLPSITNT